MARRSRHRKATNPFEGLDGAQLSQRIAEAGDKDIADALLLEALTLADFKNGGPMAAYVQHARDELIQAFKDFADINLAEVDAYKVLVSLQMAVKQHQHVTAFLTNALTYPQSPPQAEDGESFDGLIEELAEGQGDTEA